MRGRRTTRRRRALAFALAAALLMLCLLGRRSASAPRTSDASGTVAASTSEALTDLSPESSAPVQIDVAECERICRALDHAANNGAAMDRCIAACAPGHSALRTASVSAATNATGTEVGQRIRPRIETDLPEDTDLYEFGTDVDATRSYVTPVPRTLPEIVNHRHTYSRVFSQGDSPACSWLASLAALEESSESEGSGYIRLSAMHLLAHGPRRSWTRMFLALQYGPMDEPAADALTLRWDEVIARHWMEGTDLPADSLLARLDQLGTIAAVALRSVYRARDVVGSASERIAHALAAGLDVVVAFRRSQAWNDVDDTGVIPEYQRYGGEGHSVLFVGYRPGESGRQFVFRNSWSRNWGDHGYGFVSDRVVDRDVVSAYSIQAGRRDGIIGCAEGWAELIDGRCHRVWDDAPVDGGGGKRPSATCPIGEGSGGDGSCARSCRTMDVHEQGFDVHCTASGCTWTVDDGLYGCRAGVGLRCSRRCPAPTCELMTNTAPDGHVVVGCGGGWDEGEAP